MQKGGRPVSQWSNDEIQKALVNLGSAAVPVTQTTRPLLERKLERLLFKKEQEPVQEESQDCSVESETVEGGVSKQSDRADEGGYYGVVVDAERSTGQILSPFYTNRSDAVRAIKNIPGARFKKFNDPSSAETFSNSPGSSSRLSTPSSAGRPSPSSENSADVQVGEKPNQFPSLKMQDLTKFKSIVESGDVAAFSRAVWTNPRYLINCYSDSPEILQGGFRYNTLHCAVRTGRLEICKELVSILQNADFWRLVYPNDLPESVLRRRTHILDLYLNMQDKVASETPLHFACKLGHLEIVKFLLSQPSLDTTITNKFNKTAADVVCERAQSPSKTLKDKINDLISAPPTYYVPVLRAVDNCTPPQLTPPCTVTEYQHHHGTRSDNRGTPLIGQAFAGPMSPSQAEEFYREWRSPSDRRDWREALHIKRSDSSRGFERVGRQLAEQCDVGWHEYWEFLGCYCDLKKTDGLEKLEEYLATLYSPTPNQQSSRMTEDLIPPLPTHTGTSANISRELFPTDDCEAAMDVGTNAVGGMKGGVTQGEGGGGKSWVDGGHGVCGGRESRGESVTSDVELVISMASLSIDAERDGGGGEGERGGGERGRGERGGNTGYMGLGEAERSDGGGDRVSVCGGVGDGGSVGREGDNNTHRKTEAEPVCLSYSAPETKATEGRRIFLLGNEPTKVDHDVYLAVRGASNVTTTHYPHVMDWMKRVEGYSEPVQKGWRTPQSSSNRPSLHQSGSARKDTPSQTLVSPLLTSPPRVPLPRPPVISSPHSPPHRLHTSTLTPRRHFSPLHRSLNASATPSRLHHTTPIPRKVLPTDPM